MKNSKAGLIIFSALTLTLTACGNDKQDKPEAVKNSSITSSTDSIKNSASLTPTSASSDYSSTSKPVTSSTSPKVSSSSSLKSVTSISSQPSNHSSKTSKSSVAVKFSSTVKTSQSPTMTNQSSPIKVNQTGEFFKNTTNVVWANSGDLKVTKKSKNPSGNDKVKNLPKGFYTIDVNCYGGDANISLNHGQKYPLKCVGKSNDGAVNACLKSNSDVESTIEAVKTDVKYIWQMRKVSDKC